MPGKVGALHARDRGQRYPVGHVPNGKDGGHAALGVVVHFDAALVIQLDAQLQGTPADGWQEDTLQWQQGGARTLRSAPMAAPAYGALLSCRRDEDSLTAHVKQIPCSLQQCLRLHLPKVQRHCQLQGREVEGAR